MSRKFQTLSKLSRKRKRSRQSRRPLFERIGRSLESLEPRLLLTTPYVVNLALVNDTGTAGDGVTTDARIGGSLLAAAHGEKCVEDLSAYYLADEIRGMTRGVTIAISCDHWKRAFGNLSTRQMANLLIALAKRVRLECFTKNRRGPKKPRPPRTSFKDQPHVSTARILNESRGRKIQKLSEWR